MKKSINAWSVDASTGFEQMFSELRDAGFDGVELNVDAQGASAHCLTMKSDASLFAEIRALSAKYALPVVSISTSLYGGGVKLGSPDPAEREFGQALLKKQLECASALGADAILIVPGGASEDVTLKTAYDNSFETIRALLPAIEKSGVRVGVENVWNGFFSSPYDMCSFIDRFESPFIGAYYDVGNVIAFSWSQSWIELLGERIFKIHVKDFKRGNGAFGTLHAGGTFVDLTLGDVNWAKVIPALKKAGFDGYLTAEVWKADESVAYTAYYRQVADTIGRILAGHA